MDERFQKLRAFWPRPNVGARYAEKKFIALKASDDLFAQMLAAIQWQSEIYWIRARRSGLDKVPHLSTWINQKRWEDDEVDGYSKPANGAATARTGCLACGIGKDYHERFGCGEFKE